VYQQLVNAANEFFPERGISDAEEQDGSQSFDTSTGAPRLHRLSTGISSIVGPNNGDRPGGFVLVIDGLALGNVRSSDTSYELHMRLMHFVGSF
jgi:phospholipid-translocating ATPase